MRVVLLNYEFPPMGGGAGHASFQIARHLAATGCAVDVVTSAVAGQPPRETIDGVRVHRVRSLRRSMQECGMAGAWTYVLNAQPALRRLLREQPVEVLHYFFSLPTGFLALCTPGAGRIPTVVSLRGSDVPGYDADSAGLRLAHRLLLPVTRCIWRRADRVIANSHGLRALAERVVTGLPIGMIPNGVDCAMFAPRPDGRGREPMAGGAAAIRILAVARLIPRKGLDDLVRALALLRDDRAMLLIQGQGRERTRLEALAARAGVARQVTFAGFLDRAQLPAVYQAADLFVLPSHSESCAMALLEAMACGLPVVATAVGGTMEHVREGLGGLLVPPGSPEALAKAMRTLIDDPEARRRMGAHNARTMRQAYAWEGITDQYLSVYRQIVAGTRSEVPPRRPAP